MGDRGVDGINNIKIDIREVGWGMGGIDLAQQRDRWRVLVNMILNLRVPKMRGIS